MKFDSLTCARKRLHEPVKFLPRVARFLFVFFFFFIHETADPLRMCYYFPFVSVFLRGRRGRGKAHETRSRVNELEREKKK